MKTLTAIFILFATPAFAHLGHFGEFAGHDHWIAAGALGAAALAAWLAGKGKEAKADSDKEEEDQVGAEA